MDNPKLKIKEAKTFKDKLLGFMFKKSADYALLFSKCSAVHTCFMRFDIKVVFMSEEKKIIKEIKILRPWRIAFCKGAYYVLDIPVKEG